MECNRQEEREERMKIRTFYTNNVGYMYFATTCSLTPSTPSQSHPLNSSPLHCTYSTCTCKMYIHLTLHTSPSSPPHFINHFQHIEYSLHTSHPPHTSLVIVPLTSLHTLLTTPSHITSHPHISHIPSHSHPTPSHITSHCAPHISLYTILPTPCTPSPPTYHPLHPLTS